MTLPDQRWKPVGSSASPAEQDALDAIRRILGDIAPSCYAWPNIEVPGRDGLPEEFDLLLLDPRGVFAVELKGWHGRITGRGYQWEITTRSGRRLTPAPVKAVNAKARRLKGLLQEELAERRPDVRCPFIEPLVVLHGRGSSTSLDEVAAEAVVGLDGFEVRGLPSFREYLESRRDRPALEKNTLDAVRTALQRIGMLPVSETHAAESESLSDVDPGDLTAAGEATHGVDVDEQAGPLLGEEALPPELFGWLTDEDLVALGVPPGEVDLVRMAEDVGELEGFVRDEVIEDLDRVLSGAAGVAEVVEARLQADEILAAVDEDTPAPDTSTTDVGSSEPGGDPARTDDVSVLRRRRDSRPTEVPTPRDGGGVLPESLLTMAGTEALAGRLDAARALVRAVRERALTVGPVPWWRDDVTALAGRLARHTILSQRLALLVDDEPTTATRVHRSTARVTIGSRWQGHPGRALSLLVGVSDVYDRDNSLYLSQVIGRERAAVVNARLRQGRPDGGRVRVTADGTIVSRRAPGAPWFVVGRVAPDEWFPE